MSTAASIPDIQKAWLQVGQGTPQNAMQMKTDWPVTKKVPAGKVLVRVQAAALNPVDHKTLETMPNFVANRPRVSGTDFAGYIVDPSDSDFKAGDPVFGYAHLVYARKSKQGALGEYVVVPAHDVARLPSNIKPIEAAGVTLTAVTALQILEDAQLEEGQTVLINGGSTSVGLFVIQIAKIKGAKVVAVASGKKEELCRRLGADEFIDYTKIGLPLHEYLVKNPPPVKYNVIVEAVGLLDPSLYTYSKPYLAPNGAFLSVGPQPSMTMKAFWDTLRLMAVFLPSVVTGFKPRWKFVLTDSEDGRKLRQVQQWLEEGKIKPLIDSEYSFEDTLKGFERIMTGQATGKVVIKVDPSIESYNANQITLNLNLRLIRDLP
ncbi:quinone oxidoreductase [Coprinopsis sp. MPI-PUGE-AT-0042]|nr:quinone oxidoreductase [Coprinopsis sp. MPI-PUGE-AT-0042]